MENIADGKSRVHIVRRFILFKLIERFFFVASLTYVERYFVNVTGDIVSAITSGICESGKNVLAMRLSIDLTRLLPCNTINWRY